MAIDASRSRRARRAARGSTAGPEVQGELEGFVNRLRLNGATEDEVQATVAAWDNLDDGWTAADRYAMCRWPDQRIRDELDAIRAEYRDHTT